MQRSARMAARLTCKLLMLCVLAACAMDRHGNFVTQADVEAQTPYTEVLAGQAWINPPGMRMVMMRRLLGGSEQRIGLENLVPVPGDNVVILRTREGTHAAGTLRFNEFMERVGGVPVPFDDLDPGELLSGEDTLGSYFWTERLPGSGITCVFGIRRLTAMARQLPGEAGAMDMMLRNCVPGSREDALRPLLDQSVWVRVMAGLGPERTRLISPLAAPGIE